MDGILAEIRKSSAYQGLLSAVRQRALPEPLGLPRSTRLPFVAALQKDLECNVLLVTDRDDHALVLWEELAFWTATERLHFAEPNPLFYESAPWSPTVRRERLQALISLASSLPSRAPKQQAHSIVVGSARAVMTRTMPPDEFLRAHRPLTAGARLLPDLTRHDLAAAGYLRSNVVLEPGQFAIRGGILDVWAQGSPLPVRLELVGDEVNSIRTFDPVSQRTVEVIQSIQLPPAREFLIPLGYELADGSIAVAEPSEFDLPVFHPSGATLLDYMDSDALVILDDSVRDRRDDGGDRASSRRPAPCGRRGGRCCAGLSHAICELVGTARPAAEYAHVHLGAAG